MARKHEELPLLNPTANVYESETAPSYGQASFRSAEPRADDRLLDPAFQNPEDSAAYQAIAHLLVTKYRKRSADDLDIIRGNSSRCVNLFAKVGCLCGVRTFDVPNGCLRLGSDGSGSFLVYGPGVHLVINPFLSIKWSTERISNALVRHGDRTIVTVNQGHVGYCEDMGQPVLLPPGLHEWRSATLKFVESVDLNNTLIRLGPYTVLTVDEGYAAITQNNGRQVILDGGKTHLLSHRNWKFEKFMSLKISTDDLQRIEATSADNVKMHTTASCVWRITDVMAAARMSAETMRRDGRDVHGAQESDMSKLRNDVLKQATASLAAFIGEIRYSDSFHLSAQAQKSNNEESDARNGDGSSKPPPVPADLQDYSPIWDTKRMNAAVKSANEVTATYGVSIISINIISAVPADAALQNALAKGAVASAEAEMAETVAVGDARAARIRAEGDAAAEIIRAEGAKTAADKLSATPFAVEIARLEKLGHVFSDKTSFFFGNTPHELGSVLANPGLVAKP